MKVEELQKEYNMDIILISVEDDVYRLENMPDDMCNTKYSKLDEHCAYLDIQGFFYILRGKYNESVSVHQAGIYDKDNIPVLVEPSDGEKDEYLASNKIINLTEDDIIQVLNSKDKLYPVMPISNKVFAPDIGDSDSELIRLVKLILAYKNIDLDIYKDRFPNKNALFNFKQSMKKSNLTVKLFSRFCEAFNLKYNIIVEEIDPDNAIGESLTEPIEVSSSDEYKI